MKLFKDYIPYLVDIEEPKEENFDLSTMSGIMAFEGARKSFIEKRYPTKALKWKRFEYEKPKINILITISMDGENMWLTKIFYDKKTAGDRPEFATHWIEAEAYEEAKAKEDMWLPLGEGWDDMSNGCFYNDQLGVAIFIRKKVVQIDFIKISSNALIPIEICTLEIVQKLIENIKQAQEVPQAIE